MGEVYAARDVDAQTLRLVAVKTTKRSGVEADRLLQDEARIASRIDHQNVCRVHEFDKHGNTQYLVMDYCDGASLHELLEALPEGCLPAPLAVKITALVAAGLHAAHELRGAEDELLEVIHRDVSPQNVLISSRGHVAITDFGVAKARGQAHRPTETGEVKGKTSYMAPEQIRSRTVDRRVDVFALSCVLYQALLGVRPFSGESAVSTMYRILEEDITSPSVISPTFPGSLEKILLRGLEKNPDQRFSTAEELQIALETWLVEEGHLVTEREIGDVLMGALGNRISHRKSEILRRARVDPSPCPPEPLDEKTEVDSTPPATALLNQKRRRSHSPGRMVGTLLAGFLTLASIAGALAFATTTPPSVVPAPESSNSAQESSARESAVVASSTPKELPSKVSSTNAVTTNAVTTKEHSTVAAGEGPFPDQKKLVQIQIQASPKEALISIDGQDRGVGSVIHSALASSTAHRVTASLNGYFPKERVLTFQDDQTVELELDKIPRSRPMLPRPPRTTAPRSKPTAAKRTLDADNPFAN